MGLLNKIKNKAKSAGGDGGGFVGGGGAQTQMNFGSGVPSAPLEQSMNRYRFQRGLNLGSWFTTEAWLATQLYSHAADPKQSDFDLARANDAKALMEHHWDTWVTDDDWNWIKQRGFNSVRIPVSVVERCEAQTATCRQCGMLGDVAVYGRISRHYIRWPGLSRAIAANVSLVQGNRIYIGLRSSWVAAFYAKLS